MDRRQLSDRFHKPELLAPAGDLKRAKTAILYGADAVYLGGQFFSLRSRASNFTLEDIQEACVFAKEHGARIHVTCNIIPHNEDFEGLEEYLKKLEEFGVTAIIVASPSIMKLAGKVAPKLEVHCSTQMSITNVETAIFMHDVFGVDRAVLARECNMEDIYDITEKCPVETEAFIHGGMCVNYSGRCTLSNRMTLRDANRGGCAQSCRWAYHLYDGKNEISNDALFTMGSKDLFTADYMYDLMNAGVSSLKIEGRMKTEYYVATIVSGYRHLIDEIYENQGPLSQERLDYHKKQILYGENREVCSGFYAGNANADSLIYHETSNADVNHDFLGTVAGIDGTHVTIETRNKFNTGETLEILSPYNTVRQFHVDSILNAKNEVIETANQPMTRVQIDIPFEVHEKDILRRSR